MRDQDWQQEKLFGGDRGELNQTQNRTTIKPNMMMVAEDKVLDRAGRVT